MRSIKYFMLFFLLLFPGVLFADDLGLIRVGLLEGEVQVLIQDSTDWTDASVNLPLNEGDRLWVPENGKAELQLRGGVYARANGNSALDILGVNTDSAQFYLGQGHAYINNRRGGIKTVQVDTPLSSLRSYDNSIMMVDVQDDGATEVSVLKGYVYAESRAGAARVAAGNTLTIRGVNNAELAPIGSPDEWERWNIERDRTVTAWGESSRYLPDELHEYASDFDQNGRWDYLNEYGYVWVPVITVVEWAPYTYGRWIWIRGSYVWIDYHPWGWAPCHYGRWVFIASRGWCWVPPAAGAAYWGPGYVGWIVTSGYVAWVPLAPGEIYYGYGYFGPWSVNITTINVNAVLTTKRTFVNARVKNAVTAVERETFGTGKRVQARIHENPFLAMKRRKTDSANINIVPPRTRPQQPIVVVPSEARDEMRRRQPDRERKEKIERPVGETPRVTQPLPARPLPPERVRKIRPQELKQERPLVKNREASAFTPRPPENLRVKKSTEPRVIKRGPAFQPQKQNHGEKKEGPRQQR